MAAGRRLAAAPSLAEIRERLVAQLAGLSPAQLALTPAPPYSVEVCPALHDLARQVGQRRQHTRRDLAVARDAPPR